MNFSGKLLALISLLALAACGGGGGGSSLTTYTGSTSPATIDSTSSEAFSKASAEATVQGVDSGDLPVSLKSSSKMMDISTKTAQIIMQEPIPNVCTTGSVDLTGSQTNASLTYSNCSISGVTFSGTVQFSGDINGTFTLVYRNFSVQALGSTETIENMTISCTGGILGTCSISSDFTGADGNVYRLSNFTVTGSSSFSISGRLYHPGYGYVDITTTTPITFGGCSDGDRPDGGVILITGANGGSATITYGCSGITVSITGGATINVTW